MTYTVRGGDTLWGIAKQRLGDASRWPELARMNARQIKAAQQVRRVKLPFHGLQWPDLIYPGTVLILPECS